LEVGEGHQSLLVAVGGAGGRQKGWCRCCQHTAAASAQWLKNRVGGCCSGPSG